MEIAWFTSDALDARAVIARLAAEDAISLPVLSDAGRGLLLRASDALPYLPSREVVGSGDAMVRQQLAWFADFAPGSPYRAFAAAYQRLWDRALEAYSGPGFAVPLGFNELMLNRYEPGSLGITPHRDHITYRNLVALFVLDGAGRFFVAADRTGRDAREVPGPPGHAILMRAPGFPAHPGSPERPFHYVTDITRRRTVFGLRQEEPPGARTARTAARIAAG